MRRSITAIVAALAAIVLIAGVAVAQETDSSDKRHGDRPGKSIWATGDGTVEVDVERGGMRIYVVGDVSIEGDVDVQIDSFGSADDEAPEARSSLELTNFAGSILVRGTDYSVTIEGHSTLHGHGEGTIGFDGTGLWQTRSNKGVWPDQVGFST